MSEWPSGAALSPDRTLLAIAEVNTIELWSTSEWALLKRLGPTKERILGLAFSPKGTTIAAVGFEPGRARAPSVLMLWRVDESKE